MSSASSPAGTTRESNTSPSTGSSAAQPAAHRTHIGEREGALLVVAVVIGIAASLGNVVFHWAVDGAHHLFWNVLGGALGIAAGPVTTDVLGDGFAAIPERWYLIPLLPMAGMALLVLLDAFFPGEVQGYGLPRFLEIVNVRGGYIRRRWITLKTLAGAITIGSGMSAGLEGPIAQIGGAIGSTISRALSPSPETLRVLIASGTAAAIAATFGAPIAGVMFAEEVVLLGQSQLRSLTLLVVAACASIVTSRALPNYPQVFAVPHVDFPLGPELLFYLVLGLACGPLAVAFLRTFYAVKDWMDRSPIPSRLRPIAGASIVGLTIVAFPQVAGSGYDVIHEFFHSGLSAPLLLSLAFVKLLMTGLTLGCGGSGGVFAPAMFIGAAFGAGFATLINQVSPGAIADVGSFGLVGMGTLLAAATHAPMTAIFLLIEITRDYDVVVPIMTTAITATIAARALVPESIDEYDLARRGLHMHADGRTRVLHQFFVHGLVARDVRVVRDDASVADLVRVMTESRHGVVPVVDAEGRFVGAAGMEDLRAVLLESQSWAERRVVELARRDVAVLRLGDTLFTALEVVVAHGVEEVVVLEDGAGSVVAGLLNRSELQSFYKKRLLARDSLG